MANLVRQILVATFGMCAIWWAVDAFLIYRSAGALTDTAQRILSGDKFNAAQLAGMKHQLGATLTGPLQASDTSSRAVIGLLLLEDELKAGRDQPSAADLFQLQMTVRAALTQSPTNSFMWLTELWLKRLRGESADGGLDCLRMSYWSGPNESWIAVRRNPLALVKFKSLPSELAEQVLSEFGGLVRSGLYVDASNILAGPGWEIHEQLLSGLAQVGEGHRRAFARVLASKDISVTIPGLEERAFRPF